MSSARRKPWNLGFWVGLKKKNLQAKKEQEQQQDILPNLRTGRRKVLPARKRTRILASAATKRMNSRAMRAQWAAGFAFLAGQALAGEYCGIFNPLTADGATGVVALQVSDGRAEFSFTLDLNDFQPTAACDYTQGLTYHVHSYWTNQSAFSSANGFCGASYTGGHYDPNFACSTSSQNISDACVALGRVSPDYTYGCSTTAYAAGSYASCELGDLSGKAGRVYPTSESNLVFSLSTPFVDYQPIYDDNYRASTTNSLMWSSIVFHCAATTARLVCADFQVSSSALATCSPQFATFSSSNDDDSSDDYTQADLVVAVVVSVVICLFIGVLVGYALNLVVKRQMAEMSSPLIGGSSSQGAANRA